MTVSVSLEASADRSGPPRSVAFPARIPTINSPEHGGLAESLDQLPGELRAHDGEGQGQQDGRHSAGVVAGAGCGQRKKLSVHAALREKTF